MFWKSLVLGLAVGGAAVCAAEPREVFVPSTFGRPASVELRSEATVSSLEIQFRQVARWSEADAAALEQTQDLVIGRFSGGISVITLDLDQIKQTLQDAGVGMGNLQFSGSLSCTVKLNDARLLTATQNAVEAQVRKLTGAATRPSNAAEFVPPGAQEHTAVASGEVRTLRDVLINDLAERLAISRERLQVHFNANDEKLLGLSEGAFRFDVAPRQRRLGDVTWDVVISTDAGRQKAAITANARAWQTQVSTSRAMAFKQIFRTSDIVEKRVLSDRLDPDTNLKIEQVVGQQAGRDLGPGMVLNSHLIQAVEVVKIGEPVTVMVERGGIAITWIGKARESGAVGQAICVRKADQQDFTVVVTGPGTARLSGGAGGATLAAR